MSQYSFVYTSKVSKKNFSANSKLSWKKQVRYKTTPAKWIDGEELINQKRYACAYFSGYALFV